MCDKYRKWRQPSVREKRERDEKMTHYLSPYSFGVVSSMCYEQMADHIITIANTSLPFIMDREPDGDFPTTQNNSPLPSHIPPSLHPPDQ